MIIAHKYTLLTSVIISLVKADNRHKCFNGENHECWSTEDKCGSELERSMDAPGPPDSLMLNQAVLSVPHGYPTSYKLQVNISWKAPSDDLNKLRGFYISVVDRNDMTKACFRYSFNKTTVQREDVELKPWFDFGIQRLFKFDTSYMVTIQSLPKRTVYSNGENATLKIRKNRKSLAFKTSEHPAISSRTGVEVAKSTGWLDPGAMVNESVNCSIGAHPDGSAWLGAFSDIVSYPIANKLLVAFVAAPAKYCFEAYELRLYAGFNNIYDSVLVTQDYLYEAKLGNVSVLMGNHTFLNIFPGYYDLSVRPIDRSTKYNGRCLCALPSKICTCTHAYWAGIKIKAISGQNKICEQNMLGGDPLLCRDVQVYTSMHWSSSMSAAGWLIVCVLVLAALLCAMFIIFMRRSRKKYASSGIALYTIPLYNNKNGKKDKLSSSDAKLCQNLLETDRALQILIIYAKDSPVHQRAVENLAFFLQSNLRDIPRCKILVDFWCQSEIAENKVDWVMRSLQKADKILFINSRGAFLRYESKLASGFSADQSESAKKIDAENFDQWESSTAHFDQWANDPFVLQLDLLAGALFSAKGRIMKKMATVRFSYTPPQYALQHVTPSAGLRFEIPSHAEYLLRWLKFDAKIDRWRNFDEIVELPNFTAGQEWRDLINSIDAGHFDYSSSMERPITAESLLENQTDEDSIYANADFSNSAIDNKKEDDFRLNESIAKNFDMRPKACSAGVEDLKRTRIDNANDAALHNKNDAVVLSPLSKKSGEKVTDSNSADSGICSDLAGECSSDFACKQSSPLLKSDECGVVAERPKSSLIA